MYVLILETIIFYWRDQLGRNVSEAEKGKEGSEGVNRPGAGGRKWK